jgi:hypothetical protein
MNTHDIAAVLGSLGIDKPGPLLTALIPAACRRCWGARPDCPVYQAAKATRASRHVKQQRIPPWKEIP